MNSSSSGQIVRQIVLGFVVLAAAAVVILVVLTWCASRKLENRLSPLRAAGEPLSIRDLAPEPIPTNRNAAAQIEKMATELSTFSKDFEAFYKTPLGEAFDEAEEQGIRPNAEELSKIKEIVERHPALLPAIQLAATCEDYASLLDFSQAGKPNFETTFLEASMKPMDRFRTLARFVKWKMAALVADGKSDQAIQLGVQLLHLSKLYEKEPGMTSYLVAIACRGMAAESLNEALRSGPITAGSRAALEHELSTEGNSISLSGVLKVERAWSMSRFETLFPSEGSVPARLIQWKSKDWQCDVLDYYGEAIVNADRPWYQTGGNFEGKLPANAGGVSGAMVRQLLPATQALYKAANRDLALRRCLGILNALGAYKDKHGMEVRSIDDLGLPGEATIDPFSGVPLKVKLTPDGWVVYTVMDNGIDDGGEFKDLKDFGLAPLRAAQANPAPGAGSDDQ